MTLHEQIKSNKELFKMDIETIRKIQLISFYGGITSNAIGNTLDFLNASTGATTMHWLSNAVFATFFGIIVAEKYEAKKLKEYYKVFLDNYQKLNNTFDLKEPIEIYAMYCLLYSEGYLSLNKTYHSSNETDFSKFFGPRVLTGKAVCRNVASLLTDIYNKTGAILATNVEVFIGTPVDLQKMRHPFNKANHMITCANYNGQNYFVDPTRFIILSLDSNDNRRLIGEKNAENIICRNNKKFLKSLNEESIHNYSLEDYKILKRIVSLFQDNTDVFEKFYEENEEIYEEVTNFYTRKR